MGEALTRASSPRPRSVSLALVLLAAGLVLSLISGVILTTAVVRDPPPELAVDWDNPVLLVWLGVFAVLLLALAALPVALLVAIARRKLWALYAYLALLALGFLPLLSEPRQVAEWGPSAIAVSALLWGLQAVAVVLLFRRPSRTWFGRTESGSVPAGEWRPDPSARHQQRYWDGAAWTAHVADDGQVGSDPLDEPPQACP